MLRRDHKMRHRVRLRRDREVRGLRRNRPTLLRHQLQHSSRRLLQRDLRHLRWQRAALLRRVWLRDRLPLFGGPVRRLWRRDPDVLHVHDLQRRSCLRCDQLVYGLRSRRPAVLRRHLQVRRHSGVLDDQHLYGMRWRQPTLLHRQHLLRRRHHLLRRHLHGLWRGQSTLLWKQHVLSGRNYLLERNMSCLRRRQPAVLCQLLLHNGRRQLQHRDRNVHRMRWPRTTLLRRNGLLWNRNTLHGRNLRGLRRRQPTVLCDYASMLDRSLMQQRNMWMRRQRPAVLQRHDVRQQRPDLQQRQIVRVMRRQRSALLRYHLVM